MRQQNAELERHLICARHDLKESQRRQESETEQRSKAEERAQRAETALGKYQSTQSSDSIRQQQLAEKNSQLEKQVATCIFASSVLSQNVWAYLCFQTVVILERRVKIILNIFKKFL